MIAPLALKLLKYTSSRGRGSLIPDPLAPAAASRLESFSATRTCTLPCRSRIVLAFVYERSFRHRRQRLARQPPLHQPGEEVREWRDILADTRFFESVHVGVAVGYRNDRPRVSARRHHRVHQEAPDAAVAVHIRMDAVSLGAPVRSATLIALYVYYPIMLFHFYLIVSRVPRAWKCGPAPSCR
jgi:hypothetical protein